MTDNKKIEVLLDFQAAVLQEYGGVSRYAYMIAKSLEQSTEFSLIMPNCGLRSQYFKNLKRFKIIVAGGRNKLKIKCLKLISIVVTSFYLIRNNVDVYHPSYYLPFMLPFVKKQTKVVVTVYDLTHELFSDYKKFKMVPWGRKKLLHRADHIIVISNSTKKDLLEIYPEIGEKDISTVYLGGRITNKICAVSGLPPKYILFIGKKYDYKNFEVVQRIIDKISDDIKLVCVGGEAIIGNYDKERIIQIYCNDEQLNYVYQKAICFIYPSRYEGFGIPIIEAFENGCPVILSKLDVFNEVAEDAALFFDAESDDAEMQLLENIELCMDEEIRQKYIEKGYMRAQKFTWEITSERTKEIYKGVCLK